MLNWQPRNGVQIPGTTFEMDGGGRVTHEIATYQRGLKEFARRLMDKRVFVPDMTVQFGSGDLNRCQILKGNTIVWKGWDNHAKETPLELQYELYVELLSITDAVRRYYQNWRKSP